MSDYRIEAATKEEWAERALRAEAKLRDMALDCLAAEGQAADAYQAQLAAEVKLAKAVEMALEECPFRDGTGSYNDWWHYRRTTLAELKEEDRG
jgi:hypothetical protein